MFLCSLVTRKQNRPVEKCFDLKIEINCLDPKICLSQVQQSPHAKIAPKNNLTWRERSTTVGQIFFFKNDQLLKQEYDLGP